MSRLLRNLLAVTQVIMFFAGLFLVLRPSFYQACVTPEELSRNYAVGFALMLLAIFGKLYTQEFMGTVRIADDSPEPGADKTQPPED